MAQGAPGAPRLGNFVKRMGMQEENDPVALAKNIIIDTNILLTKQPTLRQSAATIQRSKIINTYIEKLHGDIRMLTSVKEQLAAVKEQLGKEKTDTLLAERISKEALGAFQAILDQELLSTYLDEGSASASASTSESVAQKSADTDTATATVPANDDEEARKVIADELVKEIVHAATVAPAGPEIPKVIAPVEMKQEQQQEILIPIARPSVFQVQENLCARNFKEAEDPNFMKRLVQGLNAPDVIPAESDSEEELNVGNTTGLSLSLDDSDHNSTMDSTF